jgi:guanylate kinase
VKGKLIIFSAPSGAGKTTLVKHLMENLDTVAFSVSATSRKKREGETDGKDYFFLSAEEFKKKINEKAFIEWEEVYKDHFYGTLFSEVERIRNTGKNVVFDVDVVGGLNIKKLFKDEALAIFVKPPSVEVLKQRLTSRATDSKDKIKIRIEKAEYELTFEKDFDVTIVNDKLDVAKEETIKTVQNFIQS